MRAIICAQPGDETVLQLGETDPPVLGPGQIRIGVHATALNRADLLQRRGLYPPPPGASPILGLECAGLVTELGAGVTGFAPGDRVMALLPGGGYAEEAVVDAGAAMEIPDSLSMHAAGAMPETFLTAFLNIFLLGRVQRGNSVLVHGGGSGVGTAAIALCREAGVRIFVTAGSDGKCRRCEELGAERAVNYRAADFVESIPPVDLVLDPVGSDYFDRNLKVLKTGGRLVVIATMQGSSATLDLRTLMAKRLELIGSTLRSRSAAEKAAIISQSIDYFGESLRAGRLRPVIDRVLPLEEAPQAHRLMREGSHFGKIVLAVR